MPEICRFLGMIFSIYRDDHPPPHFHVRYSEFKANIFIETGEIYEGKLPPRLAKIVKEWTLLRQQELIENWHRAQKDDKLLPVKPLE